MNERKLVKELGLNTTMKIRDFYGTIINEDLQKQFFESIREHIDIKDGDFIYIISLCNRKKKKKGG